MISQNAAPLPARGRDGNLEAGWQRELAEAVRDPAQLCRMLGLKPPATVDCQGFALRVPRPFIARMRYGDPDDPLLRQVWPGPDEAVERPDFCADPLRERDSTPTPGMLHKYKGRVLWVVSAACAVHCRYCFRRHFPYQEHAVGRAGRAALLDYLRADPSLHEVILSGGDPLSAPDHYLAELVGELTALGQLRRLRIHTRMPVALPSRVDAAMLAWLGGLRQPSARRGGGFGMQAVVVVHANHANELDADVAEACARMREAGAVLLNQTVLLRGVNDTVDAQCALSERLFEIGVLPYYLHCLDKVRGAERFDINQRQARRLFAELLAELPGYLVPKLVVERPGARSKWPLAPLP